MLKAVDMHCDTIAEVYYAQKRGEAVGIRENTCHLDLKKMLEGGYGLQNFAMFVQLERVLKSGERPFEYCMKLADTFFREMRQNEDLIGIVRSWSDIEKNWNAGKLSALLTAEEGGICEGEPAYLRILYELGVRMMTLTWNYKNELGWPNARQETPDGGYRMVPDTEHGLTKTGLAFVTEMERLGMIIDVSHLNDAGIWDVFAHTTKPFVASHSNCRALASHPRNLTDEMIKRLAERGGVAGINYCADFLRDPVPGEANVSRISDMIRHMKHMKQIGGIEVIGLGSDFDGIDGELELKNASCLPRLSEAMEQEGFTTGEIEKVFSANVLRVYREILN